MLSKKWILIVKGFRSAFINAHILERWEMKSAATKMYQYPRHPRRRQTPLTVHESAIWTSKDKEHEEEFCGIKAWIIQHEYDHLEGILFTDHLSALKREF